METVYEGWFYDPATRTVRAQDGRQVLVVAHGTAADGVLAGEAHEMRRAFELLESLCDSVQTGSVSATSAVEAVQSLVNERLMAFQRELIAALPVVVQP